MSTIDYSNVKTIKIAPDSDEITIIKNEMYTDFGGGIRYIARGLNKYTEEYLKWIFGSCIAMCSKRWQIEECLNRELGLKGRVE